MKLSHNIAYNFILTISGYLFPLITYPYVSRVLGVTNIGTYNMVDSIINYFILFSMLGIGVVGIRETAENRGDRRRLSESFRDLVAFNVFMTVIAEILL
ncbi:oligosaccharide flippase family protein, partial [Parabacteroides merdae]|nr:oligosaccharide flippase family protein [Parabacteroides merdae]